MTLPEIAMCFAYQEYGEELQCSRAFGPMRRRTNISGAPGRSSTMKGTMPPVGGMTMK